MCVSPLCNFVALHYEPVSVHACLYLEKHLSASVLLQCLAKLNICGLGMEVLGGYNEGGHGGGEEVLQSS